MATFPALEPHRRSWDFGQYAMTEEPAWASTSVRYRHGRSSTENIGQGLSLSYVFLSDAEAQLIRDHYVGQQGGTLAFNLPAVVWSGLRTPPVPAGVRWVYASPPEEDQLPGGLYDVTVPLASVMSVPPAIIDAVYTQSTVWTDMEAATAEAMTNGIFAETTQTGTDSSVLEWVQMDFGSIRPFSSVVVGCDFTDTLESGPWGAIYTENRDVEVSNDGSTWTTLFNTGVFVQGIQNYAVAGSARYMRITSVGDYLAVTEFYAIA